jgi:transposase-like protein
VNDQTIELIANRVIEALRDDLEAIAAELATPTNPGEQLTVGQVARRLGVARSTVYAHWREWGGYKLGPSTKAPIRFDSSALPMERPKDAPKQAPELSSSVQPRRKRRRHSRRDLLQDAPRLVPPLEGAA